MIPLRHTLERRSTPIVTRTLVGVNLTVFISQLFMGPMTERVIVTFGFIPARLMDPAAFRYASWEVAITLLTSLFLHGGFVHLIGNLLYLWVFGDAVEEAIGRKWFLLVYLAGGVAGSLTHTLLYPHSVTPSIGASGSIAGVLGAFLALRPQARILTLFPLVVYWAMAEIPALLFLPVWFGMQFFNGFLALQAASGAYEVAGVAWWAHVGGFLFGAMAGWLLRRTGRAKPATA